MANRHMAIDYGEKSIGVALSDPEGVFAYPLTILKHISRRENINRILSLMEENDVDILVIGAPMSDSGEIDIKAGHIKGFIKDMSEASPAPVIVWDETDSTRKAIQTGVEMNLPKTKRKGHLDNLAAALILKDYLENKV